jgi:hypothetical protein
MIRALKWIYGLIFQNFGWKILSLGIAVAIWAMVASEPEMGTLMPVQLGYKNLPDHLEIVSSEPATTVLLELRGPSVLLRETHPAVILDLSSARPGIHTFLIGPGSVNVPHGIRLVRAIPAEARFDFEYSEQRDVPVDVRFSGEGANGYVVAHYEVSPSRIGIVGPSRQVDRIQQVETDPVDVSTAVGTYRFRVNAFVNDPYVRFQGSPQVTVTVTMKKK